MTSREHVFQYLLGDVKQLSTHGVRLLAGTDFGNPCITPGASLIQELRLMQRAGVPAAEALRSATWYPAVARGAQGHSGRVATGYDADLLVVKGDPRGDLDVLLDPVGLLRRGAWIAGDTLRVYRLP
jgi:imidazolonepropionase-like amidohydrolase